MFLYFEHIMFELDHLHFQTKRSVHFKEQVPYKQKWVNAKSGKILLSDNHACISLKSVEKF